MARKVSGFNKIVNQLREEIEIQKEYHDQCKNLKREHLNGVPGIQ